MIARCWCNFNLTTVGGKRWREYETEERACVVQVQSMEGPQVLASPSKLVSA